MGRRDKYSAGVRVGIQAETHRANYLEYADSSSLPTLCQPLIMLAVVSSHSRDIHSLISHRTEKEENMLRYLWSDKGLKCSQ